MKQEVPLTRARLTTPRAAAIAGILFSVLLITSLVLLRLSVPADPHDAGEWLVGNSRSIEHRAESVAVCGHRLPLVHRRGARPPRRSTRIGSFATVFLGSGLLFLVDVVAPLPRWPAASSIAYGASPAAAGQIPMRTASRVLLRLYVTLNTYGDQDGRRVHDLDLYPLSPHPGDAALDGLVGLCLGAAASGEHQPI